MTCVHHWLVDSAGFGTCKQCGKQRQFWRGDELLIRNIWGNQKLRGAALGRKKNASDSAGDTALVE